MKIKQINHRLHSKSQSLHKWLFLPNDWDNTDLFPLISTGAITMEHKLQSYAKHQLPGGIYWNPEPRVEAVLKAIKPSNDICESILGLNDYLKATIPSSHQMVRSNLVQVKKKSYN